jgi:hypothetical protein
VQVRGMGFKSGPDYKSVTEPLADVRWWPVDSDCTEISRRPSHPSGQGATAAGGAVGRWRSLQHAFSNPVALSDRNIAGRSVDDQPEHTVSGRMTPTPAVPHRLPVSGAAGGGGLTLGGTVDVDRQGRVCAVQEEGTMPPTPKSTFAGAKWTRRA